MKTKVGVVSLGCDKNRVDSEVMLANLSKGGYEITSNPQEADVIIVNTCAFLEAARKEAIETVLEMARYKTYGKCRKIIVTGCLGQKYGGELLESLDEADAIVGANDYDSICDIVEQTLKGCRKLYNSCDNALTFGERILTSASHVAYLKIADGCNNFCSYCLIPYIRGRFRSVEKERVIDHAKDLAASGVKELILVAQDTTMYGKDLYGEPKLDELLKELSAIDGIEWIRILYAYPELMSDKLIAEIVTNPKVVKYVDIPLQHVNAEILKKMNRKSTAQGIIELFNKLQTSGISVRSTFICGFPGETHKTSQEVAAFLKKYKLRNVGFFPYSREKGTAAYKFENQVPERVKNRYVKSMYATQRSVALETNIHDVGKTYKCIIDDIDDKIIYKKKDGLHYYVGRTCFMTPEIDGVVHIQSSKMLGIGNFYDVKITGIDEYDLIGEVE